MSTAPRFSVMEFTTPDLSFAEDLEVFARAGASGIGISEDKLGDDGEDLARFRDSGLLASSFFPTAGSILPSAMAGGATEPAQRVEALARSIRRLAPFEPSNCYLVPGPLGAYDRAAGWALVVEGARTLAVARTAGSRRRCRRARSTTSGSWRSCSTPATAASSQSSTAGSTGRG